MLQMYYNTESLLILVSFLKSGSINIWVYEHSTWKIRGGRQRSKSGEKDRKCFQLLFSLLSIALGVTTNKERAHPKT